MASLPTSYTKCMIVNMRTRTAADLRCGSPQDGTRVQGHALLYGNPNQIWELVCILRFFRVPIQFDGDLQVSILLLLLSFPFLPPLTLSLQVYSYHQR